MSATLIYLLLFAALMFFMHRGHGGMGGCGGGHSHAGHGQGNQDGTKAPSGEEHYAHHR